MFIKVKDLELRNLEFDETFAPGAIELLEDEVQTAPLKSTGRAELIRENRGAREVVEDIRLVGSFSTEVEVKCARCLEPVHNKLAETFDLLYRPIGVDANGAEHAISTSETEIGYYNGDGLVLEDVLREQVLLSLPEKTLCRADCKGLCPGCGRNLNTEQCSCESTEVDTRWSALSDLRSKIKS